MLSNNTNTDILIVSFSLPDSYIYQAHLLPRQAHLQHLQSTFWSTLWIPSRLDCNHPTTNDYTQTFQLKQLTVHSFVACTKALAASYWPPYLLVSFSIKSSTPQALISPSRSILHNIRRHEDDTRPYLSPNPRNPLGRLRSRRASVMLHPHARRSPQAKCSDGLPPPALSNIQQALRRQRHRTSLEKIQ